MDCLAQNDGHADEGAEYDEPPEQPEETAAEGSPPASRASEELKGLLTEDSFDTANETQQQQNQQQQPHQKVPGRFQLLQQQQDHRQQQFQQRQGPGPAAARGRDGSRGRGRFLRGMGGSGVHAAQQHASAQQQMLAGGPDPMGMSPFMANGTGSYSQEGMFMQGKCRTADIAGYCHHANSRMV